MRGLSTVCLFLCLSMASGCSLIGDKAEPPPATLADLPVMELQPVATGFDPISRDQLLDLYENVLEVTEDETLRHAVSRRIADIQLASAEESLAMGGDSAVFDVAIDAYRDLLQQSDYAGNDQVIYQLSRAYEVSGKPVESLKLLEQLSGQFQQSPLFSEAEFRKAEHYFAGGDYAAAEMGYSRVIKADDDDRYLTNARYMLAWTRFKRQRYAPAIAAFLDTLDSLIPHNDSQAGLSLPEQELLRDCLRILAVSYSYLGGEVAITNSLEGRGQRHYVEQLYRELGDLYLSQQRYRDSADVFAAYVERYPDSNQAPVFQSKVISAFERGNFPAQVIAEKHRFVEQFAVAGAWWQQQPDSVQQQTRSILKSHIGELAAYYHSLAQAQDQDATLQVAQARQQFLRAADYYQRFIDHFPEDSLVAEKTFLLAETYTEVEDYQRALPLFERVAYQYADDKRAPEAGYAVILCYQQIIGDSGEKADIGLRHGYVDAELRFVKHFPGDSRRETVFSHALDSLFGLQDFTAASAAAEQFVSLKPVPSAQRLTRALEILAHSRFQLAQYPAAEQTYRELRARLTAGEKAHREISERIAASIYRQGELAAGEEQYLEAAQQFSRVLSITAAEEIQTSAHYDAAHYFTLAGDYQQANQLFITFRDQYPQHPLSNNIGALLLANYEKLEQWQKASIELDGMVASSNDKVKQGQLLYLSAQYQDRDNNNQGAIERYRRYAHGWEQPIGLRMEAMNRLAEIYALTKEPEKQRFWWRKMINAHESLNIETDDRILFLATKAASHMAIHLDQQSAAITLSVPLKQSLARKKKAMELAVAAHRRVIDMGVQPFSSQATYSLAQAYWQLGDALLESPRPTNLDQLAQEQYQLMLEDLAFPFEERAIAVHESNVRLAREGIYNSWVKKSFDRLAVLKPARYAKTEIGVSYVEEIL